jgi:hypothetical protein
MDVYFNFSLPKKIIMEMNKSHTISKNNLVRQNSN